MATISAALANTINVTSEGRSPHERVSRIERRTAAVASPPRRMGGIATTMLAPSAAPMADRLLWSVDGPVRAPRSLVVSSCGLGAARVEERRRRDRDRLLAPWPCPIPIAEMVVGDSDGGMTIALRRTYLGREEPRPRCLRARAQGFRDASRL